MGKRLGMILLILILTTGCTVNKETYESIIGKTVNSKVQITNTNRAGYKYYLPKGIRILNYEGSNEILGDGKIKYYLYVDRVSYFNKIREEYQEKTDVVFSKTILKDDLFGYIEIKNTENDKYFIEIMYNYAKIEVIVDKKGINKTIASAMSILSSITYQDEVLTSYMEDNMLKSNEVEHNIFESAETESEYLQIVEEYGQYEEKEEIVDPDFIRR